MKKHSDQDKRAQLRQQLLGLGGDSTRKSYYPELQQHLDKLERFKSLLDSSFDLIILVETATGTIVEVNRTTCEILGFSNDVICGMPFHYLLQSKDKTFLTRNLHAPSAGAGNRVDEHPVFTTNSGDLIHVEVTINTLDFKEEGYAVVIARDITGRRQQEQSLAESEERFRSIFHTSPSAIIVSDPDGTVLMVNEAFTRLSGYESEDVIGRTAQDLRFWINPTDRERMVAAIKAGGQIDELELEFRCKGGELVICLLSTRAIYENNKMRLLNVVYDVTEQKKTATALAESEERFRSIFHSSPDAVILTTIDGKMLSINRGFTEITGYTQNEVSGRDGLELGLWAEPDLRERTFHVLRTDGLINNVEAEFIMKNGESRYGLLSARLIKVAETPKVLIVISDITQIKRTEEALRTSETRFRTLIDNIPAAVYRLDTSHPYSAIFISSSIFELTGYSADNFLERTCNIGDIIYPDDFKSVRSTVEDAIKNRQPFSIEYRIVHANGDIRWVHERGQAVTAANSQGMFLDGAIFDISGRIEAEEKLKDLDRAKNEFISTAAHELRTPLTSILGYTELLRNKEYQGQFSIQEQAEFVDIIYQKGESLSRIIDDLLDISKIESGYDLHLQRKEHSITKLLQSIVEQFNVQGVTHPLILTVINEIPGELLIDAGRMSQVFENLLSNAIKYSPEGGDITIEIERVGDVIKIVIKDSGIGMDEKQLEHIFDKFYRADASNTAIGGLGLGMSIVKQIVAMHDGHITLESSVGVGTAVSISIPITPIT